MVYIFAKVRMLKDHLPLGVILLQQVKCCCGIECVHFPSHLSFRRIKSMNPGFRISISNEAALFDLQDIYIYR